MTGLFEVGNVYKLGSLKALCLERVPPFIKFYTYSPSPKFGINGVVKCRKTLVDDTIECVNIDGYKMRSTDVISKWAMNEDELGEGGAIDQRLDFHRNAYEEAIMKLNSIILKGNCNEAILESLTKKEIYHNEAIKSLESFKTRLALYRRNYD